MFQGIEIACRSSPLARKLTTYRTVAGALKLVAEAFPWQEGSQFVYTQDNHNSVLGIRELALDQGATATCVEMTSIKGELLSSCASLGIHLLHAVPHHTMSCCASMGRCLLHAVPCHIISCCT